MNDPPSFVRRAMEGMTVFGADDAKIGPIIDQDDRGRYIVVEKGTLFTKNLYIPYDTISGVDGRTVHLKRTKEELDDKVWQQPPQERARPTSRALSDASAEASSQTEESAHATDKAGQGS